MTIYYDSMIPMDLEINVLRCFWEVARTGSFTRAGKHIGLTQSGVSIKIRRLEDRLERPLFNRSQKNLSLTLDGETLQKYALRILAVHDEAVNWLTRPQAVGTLRVGLIDYFLPELLPDLLSRFRRQYPKIRLEVVTDVGTRLVPLFQKGELDLVVAGKDAHPGSSRTLAREPLIWAMGKEMDLPPQGPLPLVLLPAPCIFRQLATQGLNDQNRDWDILFTGTSMASIQAAVQAGMGLSVLPQGALREGIVPAPAAMELPELPPYTMALFTHDHQAKEAGEVFIRYLENQLKAR